MIDYNGEQYIKYSSAVKSLEELGKEKDKEIERLKEKENILQESFSDWKKRIEKEKKYYLCERTDCCGRIKDSKKYSSLYQENNKLHSIIKEVREYIKSYMPNYDFDKTNLIKLLEILDKVGETDVKD